MTTAVITGASSGIGLELAKQFAKHKHNVTLVARREDVLNKLADEIKEKYKVQVHVLAKDLSDAKQVDEVYEFTTLHNLQVKYLVNNAGFGDYAFFNTANWEKLSGMIDVNIKALTRLSWLYVKDMIKNERGKIMNVASTAAFQPGPLMAVYFATKSYVLSLSEAMANELEDKGVTVTALCPGPTQSEFLKVADMHNSKMIKDRKLPSSKDVAAYGYKAMMKGKNVAIQGTMNYIMAQGARFVPRNTITKLVRVMQEK